MFKSHAKSCFGAYRYVFLVTPSALCEWTREAYVETRQIALCSVTRTNKGLFVYVRKFGSDDVIYAEINNLSRFYWLNKMNKHFYGNLNFYDWRMDTGYSSLPSQNDVAVSTFSIIR